MQGIIKVMGATGVAVSTLVTLFGPGEVRLLAYQNIVTFTAGNSCQHPSWGVVGEGPQINVCHVCYRCGFLVGHHCNCCLSHEGTS
jgi:hypothetical protein